MEEAGQQVGKHIESFNSKEHKITPKITATIKRMDGVETIRGTMAGQSTSFYLLKKEADHTGAGILEWFAKDGPKVKCEMKDDNELKR